MPGDRAIPKGVPAVTARPARCSRLGELRRAAQWTQQQLAAKLAFLAWTKGEREPGVNADMVAKWERGERGVSARYRRLLCELFNVTPEQLLGTAGAQAATPAPPNPIRDPNSLVVVLDNAAALLDQLGAPGTALAPQMLSAWKNTATTRRTMLGLLDLAGTDPAGHAQAATATIDDLQQLADRYQQLYETADPTALLTSVAAHVKMATQALRRDHTTADRRRLLRNIAQVATLAGRLACEDFGERMTGRAFYTQALDAAFEADDHCAAVVALGRTAQLAHSEGLSTAALHHLAAACVHAEPARRLLPWLATIEATIHADRGDDAWATEALQRAHVANSGAAKHPASQGPGAAQLAAVTGHVHLQAGQYLSAREAFTAALDRLPATARRANVIVRLDLASAELLAGNHPDACRHAMMAVDLLGRVPFAQGAAHLREFRHATARSLSTRVLRVLDECLAGTAA